MLRGSIQSTLGKSSLPIPFRRYGPIVQFGGQWITLNDRRLEAFDPTTGGDLAGALGHCGEVLTQDHHIPFSISVTGTPRPFDPALCKEAYDIGREAMSNAFRHAHAAKIETEVAYETSGVRLSIRDDGQGIDQTIVDSRRPGHWGLRGMRERARVMGAELNIRSCRGAGTEIELTIPAEVAYPDSKKKPFWNRINRGLNGNHRDTRDRRN